MLEESAVLTWTLFYSLFVFCQLLPPSELASAGLTVEGLLSPILGSESRDFIDHHLRRTTANWLVHWSLPLGYFVGLLLVDADLWLWQQLWFLVLATACLAAAVRAALVALSCWLLGWHHHWLSRALAAAGTAVQPSADHADVAADINQQFRSYDKFVGMANGSSRVVITETWLLNITPYTVRVAPVDQVCLHLEGASSPPPTLSGSGGSLERQQTILCRVTSTVANISPFHIRILSSELETVRHLVGRRVTNLRHIVIQQTLTEQFIADFCRVVDDNLPVYWSQDLDVCLGCGDQQAAVSIQRQCLPESGCQTCKCRPMWCTTCFAKWFASRQDHHAPHLWLSAKCPCPTCRSTFCLLDVRNIITGRPA